MRNTRAQRTWILRSTGPPSLLSASSKIRCLQGLPGDRPAVDTQCMNETNRIDERPEQEVLQRDFDRKRDFLVIRRMEGVGVMADAIRTELGITVLAKKTEHAQEDLV